jgi:exoribonuclease-2
MNVFYEEEGVLRAGLILADHSSTLQVESPHGKRGKIKAAQILLRFESPSAGDLLRDAQQLAESIDPEFLWSCSTPNVEIGFEALALDYVGHTPSAIELAGVLLRLHESSLYFYKKTRGVYRPAPEVNLRAALQGLEKKRAQEAQKQVALADIQAGRLPDWLTKDLNALLYQPDKNTLAYKTLESASAVMHLTIPQVLVHCGALKDSRAWHEGRFQHEYFGPLPTDVAYDLLQNHEQWPKANAQAFSVDDATTTEIDDAFSVGDQDADHWRIGIHIAAPGLGFAPGSELDHVARQRLSTVYMPGDKIPMLPEAVINTFTLAAGRTCPTLSLYLTVRKVDYSVVARESLVERIHVAANLRLHELEPLFEMGGAIEGHPYGGSLQVLWQLARSLAAARGEKDKPPMQFLDFNFTITDDHVDISQRPRGSPLDTLVAELMIEVNTVWGKFLAESEYTGLFRTQVSGKTSLSTKAAPHQGLGVAQYAWSSSPLRRYVDLVNQWQLVALLSLSPTPFSAPEDELSLIARQFEVAYDAYNEFQRNMERYWSLRWLQQEGIEECDALMLREGMARLQGIPFVTRVTGAHDVAAGTAVRVTVERINVWDITVVCHLKDILVNEVKEGSDPVRGLTPLATPLAAP